MDSPRCSREIPSTVQQVFLIRKFSLQAGYKIGYSLMGILICCNLSAASSVSRAHSMPESRLHTAHGTKHRRPIPASFSNVAYTQLSSGTKVDPMLWRCRWFSSWSLESVCVSQVPPSKLVS